MVVLGLFVVAGILLSFSRRDTGICMLLVITVFFVAMYSDFPLVTRLVIGSISFFGYYATLFWYLHLSGKEEASV